MRRSASDGPVRDDIRLFLSDRWFDPIGGGTSHYFFFDKTTKISLVTLAIQIRFHVKNPPRCRRRASRRRNASSSRRPSPARSRADGARTPLRPPPRRGPVVSAAGFGR